MNQEDLAIFRQIEQWMTEHTGYPTVSGHDEFLYEPDKPLKGDLSEYAYQQRGALGYVIELWDLFARLGMPRPPKFVQYYERENGHRGRDAALLYAESRVGTVVDLPWLEHDDGHLDRARSTTGRVMLAGGLGPENVAAAIEAVRPWAVDSARSTETSPGVKDHDKVRRWVEAAR